MGDTGTFREETNPDVNIASECFANWNGKVGTQKESGGNIEVKKEKKNKREKILWKEKKKNHDWNESLFVKMSVRGDSFTPEEKTRGRTRRCTNK